jgi:hypothetical protein
MFSGQVERDLGLHDLMRGLSEVNSEVAGSVEYGHDRGHEAAAEARPMIRGELPMACQRSPGRRRQANADS